MIYYNGEKLELRCIGNIPFRKQYQVVFDGMIRYVKRSTYRMLRRARLDKCDISVSSITGEIKLLKIYIGKFVISFKDEESSFLK